MTYLYETPDPSIHGVLLPELDDWSEFDFGIFFMDDINTPQTLRHRPGLPSCKCHGFGINFYGPCPEDRDERNEPPSNEQRRYDESIFRRGEQHVAQRTPFTAQYQEFWADTMDNDIEDELEFSSKQSSDSHASVLESTADADSHTQATTSSPAPRDARYTSPATAPDGSFTRRASSSPPTRALPCTTPAARAYPSRASFAAKSSTPPSEATRTFTASR